MKVKYFLPGLNAKDSKHSQESDKITKQSMPKTFLFYNDPNSFYKKYCNNLDHSKIREKRFLEFETPNRALITHEYDMQIYNNFDYSKYYYLFNPITRLSWLKISQENKRLSIAGEAEVKTTIQNIIFEEFSHLEDPQQSFDTVWTQKKGFPCFIKLENIGCHNFLLSASYFDSIKRDNKNNKTSFELFYPFSERNIKYEYDPLKIKSSWLYIKAPKGFNITCNNKKAASANNEIDFTHSNNDEADPDKIALTIKNRDKDNSGNNSETIDFNIIIPLSLKVWFLSIYYLSAIIFSCLVLNVVNKLILKIISPIFPNNIIEKLINKSNFSSLIFAIIAAIIATRGWMISEETILKKYSISISIIMCGIIFFYITNLLI